MQCMAPGQDGLQCLKKIRKNRQFHCVDHFEKSSVLYQKYKKICNIAKLLDIEEYKKEISLKSQIAYLQKCYYVNTRAYEARKEHRKYAFIPTFFDPGHNHQFDVLLKKIDQCEDSLKILYNELIKENNKQKETKEEIDKEAETKEKEQTIEEMVEKVQSFKKQRLIEEKEMNRLFNAYIDNDKNELKNRGDFIQKLINQLKSTLHNNPSEEELFIVLQVLILLLKWNYFTEHKETNTIKFLKIPSISKKFINMTIWINSNLTLNEIQDFISLLDMYLPQFIDVIGTNWKFEKDLCPIISFFERSWQLVNEESSNLRKQYLSMAKAKQKGINANNVHSNVGTALKFANKSQLRKIKKLLPQKIQENFDMLDECSEVFSAEVFSAEMPNALFKQSTNLSNLIFSGR